MAKIIFIELKGISFLAVEVEALADTNENGFNAAIQMKSGKVIYAYEAREEIKNKIEGVNL